MIELHLDDLGALEYICNSLGLGRITVNSKFARFVVSTQREVAAIIAIFFFLNTV